MGPFPHPFTLLTSKKDLAEWVPFYFTLPKEMGMVMPLMGLWNPVVQP